MMVAIAKIPTPVSPPPVKAEETQAFDHQWQSTAPLLLREKMVPKIVRVIPLTSDGQDDGRIKLPTPETDQANAATSQDQETETEKPQRKNRFRRTAVTGQAKVSDVCTRHKMQKVYYDNNRRWKCRRN